MGIDPEALPSELGKEALASMITKIEAGVDFLELANSFNISVAAVQRFADLLEGLKSEPKLLRKIQGIPNITRKRRKAKVLPKQQVTSMIAKLLRPSITRPIVAQPILGRNQPCYCGSGVKYKHCHGSSS